MQAQHVPVILKPKIIRRQDTVSYPAPSPDPTANCRLDFRSCGLNIYTGFHLHAWGVLDQVAKPTFRNRVKDRWTQSNVGIARVRKLSFPSFQSQDCKRPYLDSQTYQSIGSYGHRTGISRASDRPLAGSVQPRRLNMWVFPSLYVRTDPYGPYGTDTLTSSCVHMAKIHQDAHRPSIFPRATGTYGFPSLTKKQKVWGISI